MCNRYLQGTVLILCVCVCVCVCPCAVSIVRGVMLSKTVSEGAGIVEDFITIFKEGKSELPISFSIGVDVGSGVTAVKG